MVGSQKDTFQLASNGWVFLLTAPSSPKSATLQDVGAEKLAELLRASGQETSFRERWADRVGVSHEQQVGWGVAFGWGAKPKGRL